MLKRVNPDVLLFES